MSLQNDPSEHAQREVWKGEPHRVTWARWPEEVDVGPKPIDFKRAANPIVNGVFLAATLDWCERFVHYPIQMSHVWKMMRELGVGGFTKMDFIERMFEASVAALDLATKDKLSSLATRPKFTALDEKEREIFTTSWNAMDGAPLVIPTNHTSLIEHTQFLIDQKKRYVKEWAEGVERFHINFKTEDFK